MRIPMIELEALDNDEVLELSWAIGEFISLRKMIRVLEVPYARE